MSLVQEASVRLSMVLLPNNGGSIWSNAYIYSELTYFINSTTHGSGGAIWGNSDITIMNSAFIGCSSSQFGGAIYGRGSNWIATTAFKNCTSSFGGAIFADSNSILNLLSVDFTQNNANRGSAIFYNGMAFNLVARSCFFINNNATNSGAIYNSITTAGGASNNKMSLDVTGSIFSYNAAENSADIYFDNGIDINIIGGFFEGAMSTNGEIKLNGFPEYILNSYTLFEVDQPTQCGNSPIVSFSPYPMVACLARLNPFTPTL
eukprot:gene10733-12492_t